MRIFPIFAATLAFSTLLALPSFAQQESGPPPSIPNITVSGVGTITVKPDLAYLSFGVKTKGKTAAETARENATRTDKVIKAIRARGIASTDIGTEEYYLAADYKTVKGAQIIVGYTVSNAVRVTVRKVADTGKILDTALQAGVNTVSSVEFGLANRQKAQEAALALAVEDAMRQAKIIAKAAGISELHLVQVSIGNASYLTLNAANYSNNIAGYGGSSPIQTGNQKVTAGVSAQFTIQGNAPTVIP